MFMPLPMIGRDLNSSSFFFSFNVYSNFIHNCFKLEKTQISSIYCRMGRKMVCQYNGTLSSVQFSSVQSLSRVRLCNLMNCSTPGLPVHHQLPEFTQTHVHRVSDAIQPSHPLSSPSPPAPNPSQHQSLFQ